MDYIGCFYQAQWAHQACQALRSPQKKLVDLLTRWLVDYLNVRLLAFFVNFAIRIKNYSENDKENYIIFNTTTLKSYGYRL